MQELVYLLKVGDGAKLEVARRFGLGGAPSHVRVSTLAPLSAYGYPAGAEGTLLAISADGLTVGVEGNTGVPRAFVPWQNIAYLADGAALGAKQKK